MACWLILSVVDSFCSMTTKMVISFEWASSKHNKHTHSSIFCRWSNWFNSERLCSITLNCHSRSNAWCDNNRNVFFFSVSCKYKIPEAKSRKCVRAHIAQQHNECTANVFNRVCWVPMTMANRPGFFIVVSSGIRINKWNLELGRRHWAIDCARALALSHGYKIDIQFRRRRP